VQELSFWKNWAILSDMGTLLDLSSLIVTMLADYVRFSNNPNSCHFVQGNWHWHSGRPKGRAEGWGGIASI
jgi:hypothetical protein